MGLVFPGARGAGRLGQGIGAKFGERARSLLRRGWLNVAGWHREVEGDNSRHVLGDCQEGVRFFW